MKHMIIAQNAFAKKAASARWRALRRFVRNRGDGARGVAAIEFAAIGGLLVLLMIPTVDFGMGFYRKMEVQNAAQAGAQSAMQYAMQCAATNACIFDPTNIQNAVVNATGATSSSNFSGITASPTPTQFCGCPTGTSISDLGTLPPCTATCPDGSNSGTYVSVSAQGTYYTLLSYPSLISSSFAFTATSTVRVK